MADPIAVVIRFSGDPMICSSASSVPASTGSTRKRATMSPPLFYAVRKTDEGIAVVSAWQTAVAHRAFSQQLHAHIDAVGIGHPDQIERMPIDKLGWG
jgi:hypothetical protein